LLGWRQSSSLELLDTAPLPLAGAIDRFFGLARNRHGSSLFVWSIDDPIARASRPRARFVTTRADSGDAGVNDAGDEAASGGSAGAAPDASDGGGRDAGHNTSPPVPEDDGCGCRVASSRTGPGALALGIAALTLSLMLVRRMSA
jgi:hypothetical protein